MSKRIIWFKGSLVPAEHAFINVLSPTAQFGLNVFEGIRGYWNADEGRLFAFQLNEHFTRLHESCRLIGIEPPYSSIQLHEFVKDVVAANDYREDIALRMTMFVDQEGTWNSSSPVEMFIAPIAKSRVFSNTWKGLSATISSWQRINDNSMPPRIKVGANYINGRYGHLQAKNDGYDVPIFLGQDGKVSEGAGACIFIVRNGKLITPSLTSSVLESITRNAIIEIAEYLGYEVEVRPVDRTELYLASEIFFCGSAAEISPIIRVDRFTVGDGHPGEISKALLNCYHDAATNRIERFSAWNTSISK